MTDAIQQAWDDVRSDKSDLHWLVARATSDMKSIELVSTGTSGLSDFLAQFENAETVMYGGMRVRAVDDRGTIKSVRAKFIKLTVIPDSLPVMRKAKAAQLKGRVDELINGTHAAFDASEAKEITKASLERQLQSTCGAHRPSYYDFDGAAGADAAASAQPAGHKVEVAVPQPAPTAPADEAVSPERASAPTKAAATDAGAGDSNSEVADVWKQVQGDSSDLNWVMITYDGKSLGSVAVMAAGTEGIAEMKDEFDDERVIYCGLRATAIDDRGSVRSVRAKYVFVQYIGSGVNPMVRAKAGPLKSHFEQLLPGTHVSVSISNADELTAQSLEQRLQASAGAHRPNGYDFGKKIRGGSA